MAKRRMDLSAFVGKLLEEQDGDVETRSRSVATALPCHPARVQGRRVTQGTHPNPGHSARLARDKRHSANGCSARRGSIDTARLLVTPAPGTTTVSDLDRVECRPTAPRVARTLADEKQCVSCGKWILLFPDNASINSPRHLPRVLQQRAR
jgi:hypothetical protein